MCQTQSCITSFNSHNAEYYYLHFANKEAEAYTGQMSPYQGQCQDFNPGVFDLKM